MAYMSHEEALARADLIKRMEDWRGNYDAVIAERDALIVEGNTAGMPNTEIAGHMTINRGTVIRVLGSNEDGEQS
jgi:hypothetical protein